MPAICCWRGKSRPVQCEPSSVLLRVLPHGQRCPVQAAHTWQECVPALPATTPNRSVAASTALESGPWISPAPALYIPIFNVKPKTTNSTVGEVRWANRIAHIRKPVSDFRSRRKESNFPEWQQSHTRYGDAAKFNAKINARIRYGKVIQCMWMIWLQWATLHFKLRSNRCT